MANENEKNTEQDKTESKAEQVKPVEWLDEGLDRVVTVSKARVLTALANAVTDALADEKSPFCDDVELQIAINAVVGALIADNLTRLFFYPTPDEVREMEDSEKKARKMFERDREFRNFLSQIEALGANVKVFHM